MADNEQWTTEEVVAWVARRLRFEAFLAEKTTWPTALRPVPSPAGERTEEPPASVA